jgi:hypothetical protein
MKLLVTLFITSITFAANISKENLSYYRKVFPEANYQEAMNIPDPISDKPTNKTILKIFNKSKKPVGYVREIKTTTGCDSACLPVVFTLFYTPDKVLKKLQTRPGLTKKFHAPFTVKDYEKLDLVLLMNPPIFKKVNHPTEMVDALSGETKKEFVPHVVKQAAYTSLRVNLYHQQTWKFLKNLK